MSLAGWKFVIRTASKDRSDALGGEVRPTESGEKGGVLGLSGASARSYEGSEKGSIGVRGFSFGCF